MFCFCPKFVYLMCFSLRCTDMFKSMFILTYYPLNSQGSRKGQAGVVRLHPWKWETVHILWWLSKSKWCLGWQNVITDILCPGWTGIDVHELQTVKFWLGRNWTFQSKNLNVLLGLFWYLAQHLPKFHHWPIHFYRSDICHRNYKFEM